MTLTAAEANLRLSDTTDPIITAEQLRELVAG
jgi:hypothetical protein